MASPLAEIGESVAEQPFSRPFVTDSEERRGVETPEGALARILAKHALTDVARPDLLAIAERNLFGPLPTEPTRRPVQAPVRPVAEERSVAKPAFRVSIGRLEIVAPAPQPEPPQPVRQRPDPKTTLQGYLDRRRQGRS